MRRINGQVVVVTGGGSGLGRAMVLGLAQAGATVVVADIRAAPAQETVEAIREAGNQGSSFCGDVGVEEIAGALIDSTVARFGRIDVLINNAGLRMEQHEDGNYETSRCLQMKPTQDLSVEEWDLVLACNLRSVFLCTHFALPHMIRQECGTLISISSNAGSKGVPGKSAYCASKHAVEGLMKTVAAETRQHNIRANAIHPGGRVNVDGRGGHTPDIVVPLVLALCQGDDTTLSGEVIKAADWNQNRAQG